MSNENNFSATQPPRRRFSRFPFEGRARVFSDTQVWETGLADISLMGVLLTRPNGWDSGEGRQYRVEIKLDGGIVISMGVTTVHADEHHLRFRCDRIDMDSFAQLKRLVELNLGEPELLNRELSALR